METVEERRSGGKKQARKVTERSASARKPPRLTGSEKKRNEELKHPRLAFEVENHQLARLLRERAQPWAKRELNRVTLADRLTNESKHRQVPFETYSEYYAHGGLHRLQGVAACIERAEESIFYIGHHPSGRTYAQSGITKTSWIQYHLSQFVYNLYSLSDASLRLVEWVFQLGITPRNCKERAVIDNTWVCNTHVKKSWKNLDGAIGPFKSMRNADIHRAERAHPNHFTDGGPFQTARLMELLQTVDPATIDSDVIKWLVNYTKGQLSSEMTGILEELCPLVTCLLNDLLPHYEAKEAQETRLAKLLKEEVVAELARRHTIGVPVEPPTQPQSP